MIKLSLKPATLNIMKFIKSHWTMIQKLPSAIICRHPGRFPHNLLLAATDGTATTSPLSAAGASRAGPRWPGPFWGSGKQIYGSSMVHLWFIIIYHKLWNRSMVHYGTFNHLWFIIHYVKLFQWLLHHMPMLLNSHYVQAWDFCKNGAWFYELYWYGILNGILVGGIPTPLKNMKVSWDDYSQYMEKNVPNHQPV